jgi:hypothetical protein
MLFTMRTSMSRDAYLELLRSVSTREVELEYGGLTITAQDALDDAQIGYGIDPQGNPLTGEGEDDWRPSWLVIGHEMREHDPIFIDLAEPGMPVYTAAHGMGYWEADPVAPSAAAFFRSLEVVARVAEGRGSPLSLEANPIPNGEREAALREIRGLNPGADAYFWESLLGAAW